MSLSFALSKPLVDYGRAIREWGVSECRPYAREADERHRTPENWSKILDTAPVPLGRHDLPHAEPKPTFEESNWVRDVVFYESINYGDVWVQPALGGGIGHLVVSAMGTPEQVERWHDPVVSGGLTTAFALTEPQFGSDTSQVATTATRDGDAWVLNGTKIFCSAGGTAEYIVVFATTDKSLRGKGVSAFVVPKGTPGLVVAKFNENKLGIRCWITSELVFDNCVIPVENQLGWTADAAGGPKQSGHSGALAALAFNRPNMGAMAIGLAQASLDVTTKLLAERKVGFTPHRWSSIQGELAKMDHVLARGRRLLFQSQYLVGRGTPDGAAAAMAKGYPPQTCERLIRRCMQLLGPEGTSKDLLLEKWYRDVKIMDIFEGSGEVQRIVVGRTLMGRLVS